MRLGADPEQLRELSTALRAAARTLDDIGPTTERRVRVAGWRGADAIRFESTWRACRRDLTEAASRCRELSTEVTRQADQQIAASRAGAPTPPTSSSQRSVAALPASPRAETRVVGGLDLRLGPAVATLAGELTFQQLDDGRTRVTLAETVAGGVALSAGANVTASIADEVGSPVAADAGSADARAKLGGVRRRSWELDDGRIDELLAALAIERGTLTAPWYVGAIVDHLSPLDVPAPDRTELLGELDTSAAGAVGLGALRIGASGATNSAVRAGVSTSTATDGTERRSTVLEWSTNTHAAITAALAGRLGLNLPDPQRLATHLRIELGDAPDGSPQIDLRWAGIDDERIEEVAVRIELHRDAEVAELVEALVRNDVGAVSQALDQLEHIELITSTGEVDGTTARTGGNIGLGPGVGVTLRGQRIDIVRGPTIGG